MTITHADKIAALRHVLASHDAFGTRYAPALRAILADLEAQQWRPIETAPEEQR